MFQTFHSCSKYKSKSSIELYDKIDRTQKNLFENIHIKYQIMKASFVTAYSWEIHPENFSEKICAFHILYEDSEKSLFREFF